VKLAPVFLSLILLAVGTAAAQAPPAIPSAAPAPAATAPPPADPAWLPLEQAYQAVRVRDYDTAIRSFQKALAAAPKRASIRKDLAYTYLKIGETEAAREQFQEAMKLDPKDFHVALEYAFLCHETKQTIQARRVFDQVRRNGDPASRATAEQAFQNIDRPLVEGITRWTNALAADPENFSAHQELASLAEQHEEYALAAEHYRKAFLLRPALRGLLLDLARSARQAGKGDWSMAALVAASRGAEPRVAEAAKELLPSRYPFVYEFREALEMDGKNIELRRELAFLLLAMNRRDEAERELATLVEQSPNDLLACAQLGFLLLGRKDTARAMPLLEKVLAGGDTELANRVRAVLRRPQVARRDGLVEAREFAERSFKAGFLKDAAKYYAAAHEQDPSDFSVMLKLAWTHNLLHEDAEAVRWFAEARKAPDPAVAAEADKAYRNLRADQAPVRFTTWVLPLYSSRWRDLFSYGQVKTEFKVGSVPLRPYISVRFIGDTRNQIGTLQPQYLSETALIVGGGIASRPWHGLAVWGEAGEALNYLRRRKDVGTAVPDYRGGLTFARGVGRLIGSERPGVFAETNDDAVFISRFDDDFLMYSQNRVGVTLAPVESLGGLQLQVLMNGNITRDLKRQAWANFVEYGPGLRFRFSFMPKSLMFTVSALRGEYTLKEGLTQKPVFYDLRAGMWYAFTH
jgi:Tfp pilus assembly protein PilF